MPTFIVAGMWVLVAACGTSDGTSNDDPEDTDLPEDTDEPLDTDVETPSCVDAVMLTDGEGGCFGDSDQWEFKVDNAGCAESGTLALWDTAPLSGPLLGGRGVAPPRRLHRGRSARTRRHRGSPDP